MNLYPERVTHRGHELIKRTHFSPHRFSKRLIVACYEFFSRKKNMGVNILPGYPALDDYLHLERVVTDYIPGSFTIEKGWHPGGVEVKDDMVFKTLEDALDAFLEMPRRRRISHKYSDRVKGYIEDAKGIKMPHLRNIISHIGKEWFKDDGEIVVEGKRVEYYVYWHWVLEHLTSVFLFCDEINRGIYAIPVYGSERYSKKGRHLEDLKGYMLKTAHHRGGWKLRQDMFCPSIEAAAEVLLEVSVL